MKLIPGFGVNADRHFNFRGAAVLVPGNRHHSDVRPNRCQGSRSRSSGKVADAHFDEHLLLRQIGKGLRVINPNASRVVQFNLPDDSVPTASQRIRNAVRVGAIRHKYSVIDANRQSVPSGRDRSEIKNMGRNEANVRTNLSVVEPDGSLPMRTFKSKDDATANHVWEHLYVTLIPSRSQIMQGWVGRARHRTL